MRSPWCPPTPSVEPPASAAQVPAAATPAAAPPHLVAQVRTTPSSPRPLAVASVVVTHSDANALVGGVVSEVVRF